MSRIVAKMEAKQWLSTAEEQIVDQDIALFKEQEDVAARLNSK